VISDPGGPTVVLSPHLDDAVLSVFHVLASGRPVVVVDLFCGVPPEGTLKLWDRLCGFSSSRDVAERRIHEEYAVLGRFPTVAGYLNPRLDASLRDEIGEPDPTFSEIAADVSRALSTLGVDTVREILAPLGAADRPHRDHLLARDAALALSWAAPVRLYADFPHCCKARGAWPVELVPPSPSYAHPDALVRTTEDRPRWVSRLAKERLVDPLWPTDVRVLDADERAAKEETARLYETQFDALDRRLRTKGIVSDPALYGVEVLVAPA
jgi:hypothetical protein